MSLTLPPIAMLTRYGVPCGVAKQAEYLVPALRALGHDVTVLSAGPMLPNAPYVVPCWTEPYGRDHDKEDIARILEIVAARGIRLVHVQYEPGIFSTRLLGLLYQLNRAGVRVLLDAHLINSNVRGLYADFVDATVVHAPKLRRDAELFVPLAGPELQPCVPVDPALIGFFGFVASQKGLLELLQAVDIVRETIPDAALRIVGDVHPTGDRAYLALIEATVAERPWCDWRRGFLDDDEAARLLAGCAVLALPYQDNAGSASGAIKFALSAGRPVVASGSSMFDGVKGLRRARRDPASVAAALLEVLSDAELRRRAAAHAAEAALLYEPERIAVQFARVYGRVLRQPRTIEPSVVYATTLKEAQKLASVVGAKSSRAEGRDVLLVGRAEPHSGRALATAAKSIARWRSGDGAPPAASADFAACFADDGDCETVLWVAAGALRSGGHGSLTLAQPSAIEDVGALLFARGLVPTKTYKLSACHTVLFRRATS